MGFYRGPNIVTNGLVLALDAANSKSYISGSTIWYDKSGNGNDATMYGIAPFQIDIAPCFNFTTISGANSANANMGFTFNNNMIPTTGSFTLSCWIKNPQSTAQTGLFANAGNTDGYRFGISNTGVYVLIGGVGGIGYSEKNISFTTPLSSILWYNISILFDRDGTFNSGIPQWRLYLNGILQGTTIMVSTQPAFTSTKPGLVRSSCCALYSGQLAMFSAHTRALSASEVLQNYNATKSRFGLT